VPLAALFAAFLQVSLLGFGGGLVWAHRIVVEGRRWLGERDFADIIGICQFLPGPNIVGIAVCVGTKLRGGAGALAALGGFLLLPWIVGLAVGLLYFQQIHHPVMQHILHGVSAAAAGLLVATGLRLLLPHRRRPAAVVFAALAFGLMAFTKLPLLVILFGLVPVSVAVAGIVGARR